ncbi:MAG: MinD/ParA family protein [Ruminococcaceae bacterium]|nr:MinD/ParA family protein [Oscillospiraceae bacterium]
MDNKRINVIVGHYGSGKTEFAVNFAIQLKKKFKKVYIVDLDIVNPYFRTNDVKKQLGQMGIDVIASEFASSNVDVPALPSEIFRVFCDSEAACVFDVGGDDDGAVALGRYKQYFDKENYDMFFVINTFRPLSSTAEDILSLISDIEASSRLKVTGLINNSNIAHLTTDNDVLKGQEIIKTVSQKVGIDIVYTSGLEEVIKKIPREYISKPFYINRYLMLDF